jgi:hypothetical protein
MKREYRGMKVVEPKMSKVELDKRKKVLKRRIPSFDNRSHFKTSVLMAVSSLIRDVTEMWAAGVTLIDVLKMLGYVVNDALAKEGHKGKIEFPFGIPFQVDPIYAKREKNRLKAHAALVKKNKAGVAICLGKARFRCLNPKCKRKTLYRWPEPFGGSHLLCSSCGWTNQTFPVDPIEVKQKSKRIKAHKEWIEKTKAGIVECYGKVKDRRCPNPKCRKEDLFKWPGNFGTSFLLCSSCGWTNNPDEVEGGC